MPKQTISDPARMAAILGRAEVGCLAVSALGGHPYAVPVNFIYLDGRIYIHGALRGRKIDSIAADDRVSFTAFVITDYRQGKKACEFGVSYESTMVFGRAALLDDPAQKCRVLNALTQKYAGDVSFEPCTISETERTAVIAVTPEIVTGKINVPRN